MYESLHNKDGSLKHSSECTMSFGRKDAQCPRCVEMMQGAPSRDGWQKAHYTKAKQDAEIEKGSRERHISNCKICRGLESGVCTFNDV